MKGSLWLITSSCKHFIYLLPHGRKLGLLSVEPFFLFKYKSARVHKYFLTPNCSGQVDKILVDQGEFKQDCKQDGDRQ